MSLISKKHLRLVIQGLKNLFNKKIKDSIKNSTADWSQNDASADNYVKNRTHWEETGEETVILPEATIMGFALMKGPLYAVQDVFYFEPELNKTYTVIWDGIGYDVKLKDFGGLACLGNENYVNMNSGGDIPFSIIFAGNIFVVTESTEASHTISITASGTIVHKIDSKFLPDDIGVQPDWNESDESSKAYIHNKPDVVLKEEVDQLTQTLQTRLVLKDNNTGYKYKLYMQDGNLTSDIIGDIQDFTYTTNSNGEYTIIGWNQTLYGNPSTEMIIPDDVIL